MGWKESSVMHERCKFVLEAMSEGVNLSDLCRRYGVSRRYVLDIRAMETIRTEAVRNVFEMVFERYGLPKAIRSDNGSPFACTRSPAGLTRLSAWWRALGIQLDRIEILPPGRSTRLTTGIFSHPEGIPQRGPPGTFG